jgi:hypothetical protein
MENTQNQEAPVQNKKSSWPPPQSKSVPVSNPPINWDRKDIIILDDDGEID